MAQKYSEAQKQSAKKWDSANLDRLSIALPKGSRETIKAHATAQGESTNAFIKRAIDCQMERDGAEGPQEAAGAAASAGGIPVSPDTLAAAQRATGDGGSGLLSADLLEVAQEAAQMTGETLGRFVSRSVKEQCRRDGAAIRMGINPATGDKLRKEA